MLSPTFPRASTSPTRHLRTGCPSRSSRSCARPPGLVGRATPGLAGGFDDGGYWVVTRHEDIKEVSLRSDIFSTWENTAIPRFADDMQREAIELQRFVLLNKDAPEHTKLRKLVSRGFTPRDHRRRAASWTAGADDREGRRRRGQRRLRRPGRGRAAPAGDRRAARRAAGGPRQGLRVVQRDDLVRRPRVRRHRSGRASGTTSDTRTSWPRPQREPGRRPRHPLIEADVDGDELARRSSASS